MAKIEDKTGGSCTFAAYFMMMAIIPTHTIPEKYQTGIAFLRYFSEDKPSTEVNYAHRDTYFLFIFVENGKGKMMIDFNEYEAKCSTILCILPGQVHYPVGEVKGSGWVLAVESAFVKNEYKDVFEKMPLLNDIIELKEGEVEDLQHCISILHKKLQSEIQDIGQSVNLDLLSSYIGMVAEIYRRGFPVTANNRYAEITSRFKSLLSTNYQSMKRPSQYASILNISPVYLNEAVKKTTGRPASDCIRDEIVIQAKRLLFHTKNSIKEIGQELGFEDCAYFTRFFTKAAGISPSSFRKKYLE